MYIPFGGAVVIHHVLVVGLISKRCRKILSLLQYCLLCSSIRLISRLLSSSNELIIRDWRFENNLLIKFLNSIYNNSDEKKNTTNNHNRTFLV